MAKFETHLSLSNLDEMIKRYENRKKDYPKIATNIANRLANEMLEDVKQATSPHGRKPYEDTKLILATIEGNIATAGIKNTTDKAYFNEFGAGIVGSQNPHITEELVKEGYKYDVNSHGEAGWWYPTTEDDQNPTKKEVDDGWIAWTKGLPAQKAFYEALKKAEERFKEVGAEELQKEV